MNAADELRRSLSHALSALGIAVDPSKIPLEHPAELAHGDYASGVALQYAKQAGMNPRELASKIVDHLGVIDSAPKIEVAGPGFINFTLSNSALAASIDEARSEDAWGANKTLEGKKIMVEYTDPNPFKEFHIGHLVPNALGESLSRLFQFSGAEVKRANWQGDVGVHVAKAIYVLRELNVKYPSIEAIASAYVEGSRMYEEDPEVKKEIDLINKKIYERTDPEINSLYDIGRRVTLEQFEAIYKILGTKFDFYFFESQGAPRGIEVVRKHPKLFPESDGAVIFPGEQYGLHTRVFINRLGLPTYEAKEIGLAVMKREAYDFDLTITITGNEQAEYFKVVMKAMELALPDLRGKLAFKTNGMLRFAEGKMSSRAGNIIRGTDLINDLAEAAKARASESRAENPELLAQQIAVAAIKYQILKQGFGKDIIFDRERALSLEGDSGPYLQYAFARANAIVMRAMHEGIRAQTDAKASPGDIERLLYRFPEVVQRAAESYEPHYVANFLIEIASAFNSWYAQVHIFDGTSAQEHKVALVQAVHRTLKNGLWILGIPAPDKM